MRASELQPPDHSASRQTTDADPLRIAEIRQSILAAGRPKWDQVTPILPPDGLYLWDWGKLDGGETVMTPKTTVAKFVRAFRKTWARLPQKDRDTLLVQWHKFDRPGEGRPMPVPHIEFNSHCLRDHQAAACGYGGFDLLFSVWHVENVKPLTLQHTIAHELGHAISYPHGWAQRHDCGAMWGAECIACECQAFSYMASWGFDPFLGLLPAGRSLVDRFGKA